MNHPTREEWMDFLYEDINPSEKSRLAEHLKTCPACERQIASWRGAMTALDQWPLRSPALRRTAQPWLRWAAAAAIFLAAGIAIGKTAQSGPDKSELLSLRQEVQSQRQLIDEVTRTVAEARARDQRTILALRKDLETVATLTEESLNNAQSQLVRLASYTDAGGR